MLNTLKLVWKKLKGHAENITRIVKEERRIDSWMKECTKCQEINIAAVFKLMDQRGV